MGEYRLPSISAVSSKKSKTIDNSKTMVSWDESGTKYCIPIVSNKIVVKNGQIKVLGDPFTPWSELSDELLIDAVVYSDNAIKLVQAEVCDGKVEGEDLDYYYNADTPSDGLETIDDETSEDNSNLATTLRLLEEISYRIFGERDDNIPKIEKVELSDRSEDDDWSEDKTTDEEDEDSTKDVEYLDLVNFSKFFVDGVLQSARETVTRKYDKKITSVSFTSDVHFHNIPWPTIEEFNIQAGIESISKYIQHAFILTEAWKYKVSHLISQSDRVSDFYFYDGKFCLPTISYPIAQATVSVYFTVEVSRVLPKRLPVRVTFTVESLRRVMTPGDAKIKDETLLRVLYTKLAVFKQFHF